MTEYRVKLRAGATDPKDVRLYTFISVTYSYLTAADGVGLVDAIALKGRRMWLEDSILGVDATGGGAPLTDADYISIVDSSLLKIRRMLSSDDVGLVDSPSTLARMMLQEFETALAFYLLPKSLVRQLTSFYKVFNVTTNEGLLGSGIPAKLVSTSANNVDVLNTMSVEVGSETSIKARVGSASKTPRGWSQGHRTRVATVYTLGRNAAFDAYLDDSGDSTVFSELRINCLDKDGHPTSFYLYQVLPLSADPAFNDREDVVYAYRFKVGSFHKAPHVGQLKMTATPVSAPISFVFTHPEVKQFESDYDFYYLEMNMERPIASSDYVFYDLTANSIKELSTVLGVTMTT